MLTHKGVWTAIDALAARHGLSASGLAKRSGLDPTTFNKSKRVSREGKPRWPSTESIAKILDATGSSLGEFVALIGEEAGAAGPFRIPVIGLAQAGGGGLFDHAGHPTGQGWDEVSFPDLSDPAAYALEVSGDGMLPVYRDGDVIVVSPAASIRRGDRVVLRTTAGDVMVQLLLRRTARRIELQSINPAQPGRDFDVGEVSWMARIVWAAQ
ncbi:MAG TPA: helix-turn-helix transcriptional regulator [Candidatus Cybelea sp.]|nr:helix-turn-helix transcriptional regulator [Candidatus Cybelea sp.]